MHTFVCICTYMYSRPRWAENCWALCWTVDRNQYSSISLYLLINSNNNRYYIIVTGSRPISGRSSVRDRKHNKSQILKWIRYFTLIRNLFAIFPYRPIWDYKIRCYYVTPHVGIWAKILLLLIRSLSQSTCSAGHVLTSVVHKICSIEQKCAVMKGCFCSDEYMVKGGKSWKIAVFSVED